MAHLDHFPTYRFRYIQFCGIRERPTVWHRLRMWYTGLLLYSFILLHVVHIVQSYGSDLMETCEEIMVMQECTTVLPKFSIFFSEREKLYALIATFKELHKRVGLSDLQRFEKCRDLHTRLARIYFFSTTMAAILYVLNAVSASVSQSMQSGELRFVTPFRNPYDYQHPVVFVLSFMVNIDTMFMTGIISMTADTCFSELANYLAFHFDIVGKRFAALDFSGPGAANARCNIVELIAYHGELLDLAEKMVRRFQHIILILLLLDSTILCVLGYQFVVEPSVPNRLRVVALAGVFITQAVIYTYNGSIITEKSAQVSNAIYASNWYAASPGVKKMICFCLMRAQRPVVMKGGFIEATLPTLKKILSSSGSYITILLSMEADA